MYLQKRTTHGILVYSELGTFMIVQLDVIKQCARSIKTDKISIIVYDSYYANPDKTIYENGKNKNSYAICKLLCIYI